MYLGRDASGATAAVKVIRPELLDDDAAAGRFAREAAVISRIDSPAVVRLLGADLGGDPAWIAVEHVPGPSLWEAVQAGGPIALADWSLLTTRLLEAVAALHRAGVAHRDLSPGNVILGPNGPTIIDFGQALTATSQRLTRTGTVVGTPGWMSPEQVAGRSAGAPSDVYSAACLLALAATGRPPHGSGSTSEVSQRVLQVAVDLDGLTWLQRRFLGELFLLDPAARPSAERAAQLWRELLEVTTVARTLHLDRALALLEHVPAEPLPAAVPALLPPPQVALPAAPMAAALLQRTGRVPVGSRLQRSLRPGALVMAAGAGAVLAVAALGAIPVLGPLGGADGQLLTDPPPASSTGSTTPSPAVPPSPPSSAAGAVSPPVGTSPSSVVPGTSPSSPPTPSAAQPAEATAAPVTRVTAVPVPSDEPTDAAQLAALQRAALARDYAYPGGSARITEVRGGTGYPGSARMTVDLTADFGRTVNGGYRLRLVTDGMGGTSAWYWTCLRQIGGTTTHEVLYGFDDTARDRWTSVRVELDADDDCEADPGLPPTSA